MDLKDEFKKIITNLTAQFFIPPIGKVFFHPFIKAASPKMQSLWLSVWKAVPRASAIYF